MRNLLVLTTILLLVACENDFTKENYDVSFYFENQTDENLSLTIFESNNAKSWEGILIEPKDTFNLTFNIKDDIAIAEGGFKAKGDTLSLNTGYYTNYQFQGENPVDYLITDKEIRVK